MNFRYIALMLFVFALCASRVSCAAEPERIRIIIETDAGGDPDDEQSMVRFLLYTNEWDVEGIIVNREEVRDGENLNKVRTGLGIVHQQVRAYGSCFPLLVQHDRRFPEPEKLLARTVAGYDHTDDGMKLVLASLDAQDARPVWFLNWGTDHGASVSCLVRALDRILEQRGREAYSQAKMKVRVIGYPHLFGDHAAKIQPEFPLFVNTFQPELDRKRWYHRFSAITATAGGFDLRRDVLTGHGPLGELYPTNTTHPQKEGDTPTFLYVVPTGMNDPTQPSWGSWAGRYGLVRGGADDKQASQTALDAKFTPRHHYYWANEADTWHGTTHRENTLARWAADLQNDFRARLDWCVKPPEAANHPPVAAMNGQTSGGILRIKATTATTVELDAAAAKDPDGQPLTCEWFVYPEPGTYRGQEAKIANSGAKQTSLSIPDDAAGKSIHVILVVRDNGQPSLARYSRLIVDVASN